MGRPSHFARFVATLLILMVIGGAPARSVASPIVSGPAACGPSWSIVSSPNIPGDNNYLGGVDAITAADGWAVGTHKVGITNPTQTLALHWDGTAWIIIPSPNIGTESNGFQAVAGASSTDVWAVGNYFESGLAKTLIQHWDGTSWQVVESPTNGNSNYLFGVGVGPTGEAWAVGSGYVGNQQRTLIEQWTGSRWRWVQSPSSGFEGNNLLGVAVVARRDAWAVGTSDAGPIVLHWDGRHWQFVPVAGFGPGEGFYAVWANSASDVWAVGTSTTGTLTGHWDGTSWTRVPSPNAGTIPILYGVSGSGTNDVWAVGRYQVGATLRTLVEHWDGLAWTIVPSPNVGSDSSRLAASSTLPTGESWAVGDSDGPSTPAATLIEQYCP